MQRIPVVIKDKNELTECINKKLEDCKHQYRTFFKYFEPIIRGLLDSSYPLDFRLMRIVYQNKDLSNYEQLLDRLECKFGEEFLQQLFAEAGNLSGQHLLIKFKSMWAEIDCAEFLSRTTDETNSIEKIETVGDILVKNENDNWKIQVKNFSEEDLNLECIEDALLGAMCWEQNALLKQYDRITLEGCKVNDSCRDKTIDFIQTELLPTLQYIEEVCKENQDQYLQIKLTRFYISKQKVQEGYLELVIDCFDRPHNQLEFEFKFGDTKGNRSIKMTMQKDQISDPNYCSISYNNTWWGDPDLNWDKVLNKLQRHLDRSASQLRGTGNKATFVRFNIHPKYEAALTNDVMSPDGNIVTQVNKCNFPVIIYFPHLKDTGPYLLNKPANGNSLFNM